MSGPPPGAGSRPTRAGVVAVVGAPNAGKSTLTNRLVGEKVSIVTHKVQTTRFPVRGLALVEAEESRAQLILVDTPGIFGSRERLTDAMVESAWEGVKGADAILHVMDAHALIAGRARTVADTERVVAGLEARGGGALLALNKIDGVEVERLLPLVAEMSERGVYDEVFLVSALKGDGVEDLAQALAARVPEGAFLYPEDQAADVPMRVMAAEITREKLFLRLHEELPYNLTVETESWEEFRDGSVKISQVVYVTRGGHKGIVLGKGGETIKAVNRAARAEMGDWLGRRVHLFLFVKVREGWKGDRARYEAMGLSFS